MADEKILNDGNIGYKYLYHHREKDPEIIQGIISRIFHSNSNTNILGGGKEDRVRRFKQALSHIDVITSEEMLMIVREESNYDRKYIHIVKMDPHFKKGTKNTIIDYIDIDYVCDDNFDSAKVTLIPRWIGVEDVDPSLFGIDEQIDVKVFCGFDLRVYFDEEEYE